MDKRQTRNVTRSLFTTLFQSQQTKQKRYAILVAITQYGIVGAMNCVILSESQIKIKNQARDVSFDVTRTDYILFESIIGQNDKLKDTLEPALERDDMVFRKR